MLDKWILVSSHNESSNASAIVCFLSEEEFHYWLVEHHFSNMSVSQRIGTNLFSVQKDKMITSGKASCNEIVLNWLLDECFSWKGIAKMRIASNEFLVPFICFCKNNKKFIDARVNNIHPT